MKFSIIILAKLKTFISYSSTNYKKILIPSLKKARQDLFSKHLLATNLTISMFFSGLGDTLEQMREIVAKYQTNWDKERTAKFVASGFPIGLLCHYWYLYLDKFLIKTTHKTIMQKIILTQILFSPACLIIFFTVLGFLNSSNKEEIKTNILTKGKEIYLVEWIIWPPASMINFYFIPLRYRILYDNLVSLGFDTFSSYVVHKKESSNLKQ
jgi:protein Mpv17